MCGTPAGYHQHRRAAEQACRPCLDALAAYSRHWRKHGRQRNRIRDSIIDLMLTEDRPMSTHVITDLVLDLHPELAGESIRRALSRMRREGLVRSVAVEEEWEFVWRLTDAADGWFDPKRGAIR